jgi:hypothetical protein
MRDLDLFALLHLQGLLAYVLHPYPQKMTAFPTTMILATNPVYDSDGINQAKCVILKGLILPNGGWLFD